MGDSPDYRELEQVVRAFLRKNYATLGDGIEDVLAKVVEEVSRAQGVRSVKAFATKVARNRATDALRARYRHEELLEKIRVHAPIIHIDPEDLIDFRSIGFVLSNRLTEYQFSLVQTFMQGVSWETLGRQIGRPPATIRKDWERLKPTVRTILREMGFGPPADAAKE